MALRFIDGFDHYTTLTQMLYKWTTSSSGNAAPNQTGRRAGSLAVTTGGSVGYFSKLIDSQSTWIIGFALKIGSAPTNERSFLVLYDSAGTAQVSLSLTTANLIQAYRGDMATLLVAATSALSSTGWCYLEMKVTIADSGGSLEVRKDGAPILTYTGDTKYSSSNATACSLRLGCSASGAGAYLIDDLYVCDGTGSANNSFLGDVRVDTLFPSGAGASAQFTPTGSTNNWENVDETSPDGDTSYNAAETAGYFDSFSFSDLSVQNATVFGVQLNTLARKDDAGSRFLRAITRISGTNYEGTDAALSDSYVDYLQLFEQNPSTSSAWTESAINNAEFGYKVQA
ncbi:MAG: hypothetical protein PHS57_00990 [Alphaproteobacteria bacterium]|nr:hypothetical protein [Alphaproteobacteria bacterium]